MYKIPKPGLYKNHQYPQKEIYIYVTHVNYNTIHPKQSDIYYYTLDNPVSLFPICPYPFNCSFSSAEAL